MSLLHIPTSSSCVGVVLWGRNMLLTDKCSWSSSLHTHSAWGVSGKRALKLSLLLPWNQPLMAYGAKPRQKHMGPTSICSPLNHGGDSLLRHRMLKGHSSSKVSGVMWVNNRTHNFNKKRKLQNYHQKQREYTYIYTYAYFLYTVMIHSARSLTT